MGYYINHPQMSKERWLHLNGSRPMREAPSTHKNADDEYAVCLVDNGPFTAAGICYSQGELNRFSPSKSSRLRSPRPRLWFFVPREKLIEVCPHVEEVLT